MTISSYPLIAVDFNRNEHNLECRGHSQGDAAKRLLREHSNFRAVLNGKQGGRNNNPYRKLIRTQHGVEPDAAETTLGQAFIEAQSTQSLEAAQLILSALQKKGISLEILQKEDGTEKIVAMPKNKNRITSEESAEIDENQAGIVALLKKQEEESTVNASAATPPKESQREIVRRMIPELPDSFIRYDLEKLLHSWKYHDLADKTSKLDNLLAWCVTQGFILRISKGHYRRLPLQKKMAASESSTPIESQEAPQESPLAVSPQEPPQLGFEPVSTQATNGVGEHATGPLGMKMPASTPPEALASTNGQTPIQQNLEVTASPERLVQLPLAQALIGLTSELATVPIEESTIDAAERTFMEFYERMDALFKQLRANARTRDRLRTQLASAANSPI